MREAPGWPEIAPRWTSSAKDGVGTATLRRSAPSAPKRANRSLVPQGVVW